MQSPLLTMDFDGVICDGALAVYVCGLMGLKILKNVDSFGFSQLFKHQVIGQASTSLITTN